MTEPRRCTCTIKKNVHGNTQYLTIEGMWLGWGHTYKECETNGKIQLTNGIVEDDEGQVHAPEYQTVKFLRPLIEGL